MPDKAGSTLTFKAHPDLLQRRGRALDRHARQPSSPRRRSSSPRPPREDAAAHGSDDGRAGEPGAGVGRRRRRGRATRWRSSRSSSAPSACSPVSPGWPRPGARGAPRPRDARARQRAGGGLRPAACRSRSRAAVALAWALPGQASAHAVLQHTTPHQNSAVDAAPSSVQLDFNEPVEVSFGAVRVYDAARRPRRQRQGRLPRRGTQSSVTVGVRDGLGRGVYTTTYRVVSADGHPVSGGFAFGVGEPVTAQRGTPAGGRPARARRPRARRSRAPTARPRPALRRAAAARRRRLLPAARLARAPARPAGPAGCCWAPPSSGLLAALAGIALQGALGAGVSIGARARRAGARGLARHPHRPDVAAARRACGRSSSSSSRCIATPRSRREMLGAGAAGRGARRHAALRRARRHAVAEGAAHPRRRPARARRRRLARRARAAARLLLAAPPRSDRGRRRRSHGPLLAPRAAGDRRARRRRQRPGVVLPRLGRRVLRQHLRLGAAGQDRPARASSSRSRAANRRRTARLSPTATPAPPGSCAARCAPRSCSPSSCSPPPRRSSAPRRPRRSTTGRSSASSTSGRCACRWTSSPRRSGPTTTTSTSSTAAPAPRSTASRSSPSGSSSATRTSGRSRLDIPRKGPAHYELRNSTLGVRGTWAATITARVSEFDEYCGEDRVRGPAVAHEHRRYVTSAVSSSISPAGATTTPLGSAPSAASSRTSSPAASQSTSPAAMSQICTPRS